MRVEEGKTTFPFVHSTIHRRGRDARNGYLEVDATNLSGVSSYFACDRAKTKITNAQRFLRKNHRVWQTSQMFEDVLLAPNLRIRDPQRWIDGMQNILHDSWPILGVSMAAREVWRLAGKLRHLAFYFGLENSFCGVRSQWRY